MNNDLISRSELKEAFKAWKTTDDYYHDTDCNDIPFSEAFDLIDTAPAVEPEITIEQAIAKIQETDLLSKHNKMLKEWADIKCAYCSRNDRPQGDLAEIKHRLNLLIGVLYSNQCISESDLEYIEDSIKKLMKGGVE